MSAAPTPSARPKAATTRSTPQLGTFEDFARLVRSARDHGLEIAIDFAIQCSQDHPWIKEHPEWFDWRPDGTIKYAENPPKKYQDIVNVHFYRGRSAGYLVQVPRYRAVLVREGRADLPGGQPAHQAPALLGMDDPRGPGRYPDALFLAEAFTKPKMMKRLAKVGFTQSYSYFTWRNFKQEITDYLVELTQR